MLNYLFSVEDIDDEYDDTARDIKSGCEQKNDSPTHRFKGILLFFIMTKFITFVLCWFFILPIYYSFDDSSFFPPY